MLTEIDRIPTSGARAVEPFRHKGTLYLVIPQLAADAPGQPPSMTGGNSDVDSLVLTWRNSCFVEHQSLPITGGEDAEFFRIGERAFLATATLRSGQGPYRYDVASTIFELAQGTFVPFQTVATFGAKQWKHFTFDGRHFLALAQGVVMPGYPNVKSLIYEWNGETFIPFQEIDSAWGYNWAFFETAGNKFLAHADHTAPSVIYRWSGKGFERFQPLGGKSGRAFCAFDFSGQSWLAFANLLEQTLLYRWDGQAYTLHQELSGPGGREFAWIEIGGDGYLVQVQFILGSREEPRPQLDSIIYRWANGTLVPTRTFQTTGGTDAAFFNDGGRHYLAISNSLSGDLRFKSESRVYRFQP
jgi:hypothetical protein